MAWSSPSLLQAALVHLQQSAPCIVAGGTDVYPSMARSSRPEAFLDVTRIDGFNQISRTNSGVRFGAAVTWSDIAKADLPSAFNALKQAAREVGSLQIQNTGTIAGNICNASPAADGVPPLLALDAEVELASASRGKRTLPLGEFTTGVRQTALQRDELVTAVNVPVMPENMVSAFEKFGSRRFLVISIVMTAANVLLDQEGRIERLHIAVGACSAVAQRLRKLEASLLGRRPHEIMIEPIHLSPLMPIDDVRATKTFRLRAAEELVRRVIQKAVQT